jgi:guanylate kinase
MTAAATHPGLLLVLCGPSGVGKSTISKRLHERHDLTYIVSATTRSRRPNDEKGKTYEYIDQDEFDRRIDADQFLEYAEVYEHWYGTPKHPALDLLMSGKDVLLEIDVQGALQVRYHYPAALLVFIEPPDERTLLERLRHRKRDDEREIAKRFRNARREIYMAKGSRSFDHAVINHDGEAELERAVNEIAGIARRRRAELAKIS